MNSPNVSQAEAQATVSVIIPAYNSAQYISETLNSVFSQTYPKIEAIVINDGSPDTAAFEQVIRPFFERIVYIRQPNQGPSAARNAGILRARGEYIAFLDSDDSWLPEYLEFQMKLLKQNPSPDLVYTDGLIIGDTPFAGKRVMEICPSNGTATFESLLVEKCQVPTSGTAARKRVLIEAGLFDENFWRAEDYDLWLRVAHRGARIAYQRRVLWRSRVHSGSLSSHITAMRAGEAQVLMKLERTLQLDPRVRSIFQDRISRAKAYFDLEQGRRNMVDRRFDDAQRSLMSANAYLRSKKIRLVVMGLKVAPRLTRWAAKAWEKLLMVSLRLRSPRRSDPEPASQRCEVP
jgi:glycosyltransferase involved in cell wall biosynthesis